MPEFFHLDTQTLQIANATGFHLFDFGGEFDFPKCGADADNAAVHAGDFGDGLCTHFPKSIDDASSFTGTGGTLVQYIGDLHLERGLSSFDQRHNLQTTFLFSVAGGDSRDDAERGMEDDGAGGVDAEWNVFGDIGDAADGLCGRQSFQHGGVGGVPGTAGRRLPGCPLRVGEHVFSIRQLSRRQRRASWGCGAGYDTGVVSVGGEFVAEPGVSVWGFTKADQLRISATNALNHVTITSGGTTVNSQTYGLPTAASGTRNVSVMLRYNF